jgi:Zn finger protein HypA/HybF involved in hydrogenase expression
MKRWNWIDDRTHGSPQTTRSSSQETHPSVAQRVEILTCRKCETQLTSNKNLAYCPECGTHRKN